MWRRCLLNPLVLAVLGAAVYLVVAPPSADLAAQEYRADLGLTLWNNGWFAGHHTPGYSVLFPPLGGLLGVRLTGALAAVAAAALFTLLARRHWGEPRRESEGFWADMAHNPSRSRRADVAALWFAAGTVAVLLNGRMTFLLGVAIGLGALLALAHERRVLAVALSAATTLASPVAGLFVALAAAAWALAAPRERAPAGAAIAAAALAPVAIMLVAFPQGGSEPFVPSAFWPALAGGLLLAALLRVRARAAQRRAALRRRARRRVRALHPAGRQCDAVGALVAGPVLLGALLGRRSPVLVAALAVAFATAAVSGSARRRARSGDPSIAASYHAPLVEFLRAQGEPGSLRVEIPFTENHWEARHVAARPDGIPLARGWGASSTASSAPSSTTDRSTPRATAAGSTSAPSRSSPCPTCRSTPPAATRQRLIEAGLPFLRPVCERAWRVFAVTRPAPLAEGQAGARVNATLSSTGVTVRASRAGSVLVRVHFTRWGASPAVAAA